VFHCYYLQKWSLYVKLHAERAEKEEREADAVQLPPPAATNSGSVSDDSTEMKPRRSEADDESVKTERRKKAALFLHQIQAAKSLGNILAPDPPHYDSTLR